MMPGDSVDTGINSSGTVWIVASVLVSPVTCIRPTSLSNTVPFTFTWPHLRCDVIKLSQI